MKNIESAYQKLPKILTKYGFSSAYVRNEFNGITIVLNEQKEYLSLSKWLEFETLIKLDISREVIFLAKEQIDNLDGYLLIKGSDINE